MKQIPLTRGKFAVVDDEDYEYLMQWSWYCHKHGYAVRTSVGEDGKRHIIWMHRFVLHAPTGYEVDHINGDILDNCRANLRICTRQQNVRNVRGRDGTSEYKGVHWHARIKRWVASISVNKKIIHIGYFDSEMDAALAYDNAAVTYFEEFAKLNFNVPTRPVIQPRIKKSVSKYRGVSWNEKRGCWQVRIQVNGKRTYIGKFTSEIEAAIAYNESAKEHYGESAILNVFD